MPKGVTQKIWSSVISKLALMGVVFVFFYIIGDALHVIPQSVKDGVSWLGNNFTLIAFLFCFTIGSYIALRIIQTKRSQGH